MIRGSNWVDFFRRNSVSVEKKGVGIVSGKPHVPVAADHSRIKLVRKVSALF